MLGKQYNRVVREKADRNRGVDVGCITGWLEKRQTEIGV
jgi:hypothetical protein